MMSLRLQTVLTLMLAATFVADGATRTAPVGLWSFRAWEAMSLDRAPNGPFEPLARYDSPTSFGDLANMGNIRRMRIHRRETFTTDAYGFRNPPGRAEGGRVSVLLLGDSFAAGSGVSDELTLAGQLTATWGRETYSLAPMLPQAGPMSAFARILKMQPGGWVVHQQTYFHNRGPAWQLTPLRHEAVTPIARFERSFKSDIRPLRILVNQAQRSVQDDELFPNPFAGAVTRARLHNGDEMLFIAGETVADGVSPDTAKSIAESVRYSKRLSDEADKLGLRYLAVLVPVKDAVYRHLLTTWPGGAPRAPGTTTEWERQLRAADVRVLNLFEPLTSQAKVSAPRHQYVYWRDDTHWNALGIATAARAVADVISADRGRVQ